MNGDRFDRIWARITRALAFLTGLAIMGFETVGDKSERPWLYAAALGMMGLPIARAAENIADRVNQIGGGTKKDPPSKEAPTEEEKNP